MYWVSLVLFKTIQKQPSEVFRKKRCSLEFRNIHKKTLMFETLFNKAPTQMFSCEYCEIFKNTYFEKHLRTAASNNSVWAWRYFEDLHTLVFPFPLSNQCYVFFLLVNKKTQRFLISGRLTKGTLR